MRREANGERLERPTAVSVEGVDRRLERVERILQGDSGYSTGLIETVRNLRTEYETLDEKLDSIEGGLQEIIRREDQRELRVQEAEGRAETERKDRRKFIFGFVTSVVLIVVSSIASVVVQLLLTVGQH